MIVDANSSLRLDVHSSGDCVVTLTRPGKRAEPCSPGSLPTKNTGRHQVVVFDRQHKPLTAELVGEEGRATPTRKAVGPKPQITLLYWVR